eukprot:670857-Prorocentrum_minimum.AAC.3
MGTSATSLGEELEKMEVRRSRCPVARPASHAAQISRWILLGAKHERASFLLTIKREVRGDGKFSSNVYMLWVGSQWFAMQQTSKVYLERQQSELENDVKVRITLTIRFANPIRALPRVLPLLW